MPNDDYIKRSELIEHFRNYNPNWGVIGKDTVLDDIRDFPAADVEPKMDKLEELGIRNPDEAVREDPPVPVPGYVAVTALPKAFTISTGADGPVRAMIDIRDIECVIEQEDGRACIVRRSEMLMPPIVTVEDFDEVARRMRRAAGCGK